jgi:2-polyprenyl-6-methoxyphenol hydroxylase-like FAD-dependent oxidoreductase
LLDAAPVDRVSQPINGWSVHVKEHGRYDVIVVGARCAGSATAMLLARRGHSVLVVDRDAPIRRIGLERDADHNVARIIGGAGVGASGSLNA